MVKPHVAKDAAESIRLSTEAESLVSRWMGSESDSDHVASGEEKDEPADLPSELVQRRAGLGAEEDASAIQRARAVASGESVVGDRSLAGEMLRRKIERVRKRGREAEHEEEPAGTIGPRGAHKMDRRGAGGESDDDEDDGGRSGMVKKKKTAPMHPVHEIRRLGGNAPSAKPVSVTSGTPAKEAVDTDDASGQGLAEKKRKKKRRSKQKNIKKDTRSAEFRPGGASYTGHVTPRDRDGEQ